MSTINYQIYLMLCILQHCYGNKKSLEHTQKIFSIQEPTWIFKSGMSKGWRHDRQDIGIVLLENATLVALQVNPEFKEPLTVKLLGDDTTTDRSFNVGEETSRIHGEVPLVPFVETPFGSINATIEYFIIGPYHPLPIYQKGDDEELFFRIWDLHDSSYALIKHKYFQLLIPKCDKQIAKNLSIWNYDSLDSLIDHYDNLFIFFNELAGFDESSLTNRNSDNRYFLRADRHGSGAAYYGDSWTATSYATTKTWLTTSWGHLHEIGHGYQPSFSAMYVGEVTNNVFGTLFEYYTHGAAANNISWIFGYGDKKNVERSFHSNMRIYDCKYEKLNNLRDQLIILMTLTEKAGSSAITKVYQSHRAAANEDNPKFERRLPELLNRHYSDNAHLDFAPVLERLGLAPEPREAQRNRHRGYRPVAALAHVLPQKAIFKARKVLDLNRFYTTNYQLVTNDEISFLGLQGDLIVSLENISEIDDFRNVIVRIKYGEKIIKEKTIKDVQETCVTFNNVPNGVYSVEIIGSPTINIEMASNYVYVINKINKFTFSAENIKKSKLLIQTFEFFGLGWNKFAEFIVNLNNSSATFIVTSADPHSYYSGKLYVSVKIISSGGEIQYEKYINGTRTKISSDYIPIKENDVIHIYHDEPSRLLCDDKILNKPKLINRFKVTKFGLQNLELDYDPQLILMFKIDNLARNILADHEIKNTSIYLSHDKKHLAAAVRLLDKEFKIKYNKKYACLLSDYLEDLAQNDSLTVSFKSKLELLKGITVKLLNGDQLLKEQVIEGSTLIFNNLTKGVYTLELSGGPVEELEQRLKEKVTNKDVQDVKIQNVSRLIDTTFHLYGLNGQIGDFETFLKEGYATFEITTKNTHVYYGDKIFISLNVTSFANVTKYKKNVLGVNTEILSDKIPLEEGDVIELFHAEIGWRLHCDDDIIDKEHTTNKWRVTKYGLQNINLNNIPLQDLIKKIDSKAPVVIDDMKNSRLGILILEEPYQSYFIHKHSYMFPSLSSHQINTLETACDESITVSSYNKKLQEIQKMDAKLREILRALNDLRPAILYLDDPYQKRYLNKYEEIFYNAKLTKNNEINNTV